MAYFGCQITPSQKGSHQRSLSLPSFLKSAYLVSKVQEKTTFEMTIKDTQQLQVYPKVDNVKTLSEYLHRTEESMLVLFPAREKLQRSVARYKKSSENLHEQRKTNEDLSSRLDQVEEVGLLVKLAGLFKSNLV